MAAALHGADPAHARTLTLTIGNLEAQDFGAREIRARLHGPRFRSLAVQIGRLAVAGRTWRNVALECRDVEVSAQRITCPGGTLDLGAPLAVSFSYFVATRRLELEVRPAAGESVRVAADFGAKPLTVEARVDGLALQRLQAWLPKDLPEVKSGRASGEIALRGDVGRVRLAVEGLAFADQRGLQAGEKIRAELAARGERRGDAWRWSAQLDWREGEVFWQPFFAAGRGQHLALEGTTRGNETTVRAGRLDLPGIGAFAFSGRWSAAHGVRAFEANAKNVQLARLYEDLLKPALQGTALSDLRVQGVADVSLRGDGDSLDAADVTVTRASIEDRGRRFGVFNVSGRIPWRRGAARETVLEIEGAELLKVPIGRVRVPLRLKGDEIAVDRVSVPLYDGALELRKFTATRADGRWRWRFSGEVEPISMSQLTGALGIPTMHGSLAGELPELRYENGIIVVDGALRVRLFDGAMVAERLRLIDPFGRAPRLHADISIDRLDLELLTRTFDFGTITGRIDARIAGLELVDWQPVRFDARVLSSPGDYPRKISQRAVQNISALGGAGAAAALQRSFLRFFEQFGYQKLGLSCRLEDNVCHMDGIERAPQGFVIVKGGGIPAITVIGYNRSVDWRELIARLKRVTQDNVKPIVK